MLSRVPVAAVTRYDATAVADGVHRRHRIGGRLLLLAEAALLRPLRASARLELLQRQVSVWISLTKGIRGDRLYDEMHEP